MLLLPLLAAAFLLWRPGVASPLLQRALAARGVEARWDSLAISLSPLRLECRGLSLRGPRGLRVELARLEAWPDPVAWWRGEPWLSRLEVWGLDLQARAGETGAGGGAGLEPLAGVLVLRRARVHRARLRLDLPSVRVELRDFSLQVSPAGAGIRRLVMGCDLVAEGAGSRLGGRLEARGRFRAGPRLSLRLALTHSRLEGERLSGRPRLEAGLVLSPDTLELRVLRAALEGARVLLPHGRRLQGISLAMRVAGELELASGRGSWQVQDLGVPGLLGLAGRVEHSAAGLDLDLRGGLKDSARLLKLSRPWLPPALAGLRLKGALPFSLRLQPGAAGGLRLALEPQRLELALAGLEGALSGRLTLAGRDLAGLTLGGSLRLAGRLAAGGLEARGLVLEAAPRGRPARLRLEGLRLALPEGGLRYQGRPLALGRLQAGGRFRLTPAGPWVEGLVVEAAALGRLQGGLRPRAGGLVLSLKGDDLSATALPALLGPWLPGLADWQVQGGFSLALRLQAGAGAPRLHLELAPRKLGLSSPDASFMLSDLGGGLRADLELGRVPRVSGEARFPRGEALWGTYYLDLAKHPLALQAAGSLAGGGVRGLSLELDLAGHGRLKAAGDLLRQGRRWAYDGRLALRQVDLGAVFATFVRDPLADERPDLAAMRVQGRAGLELVVSPRPQGAAHLEGRLWLHHGGLVSGKSGTRLQGIDLELPFTYLLGGRPAALSRPRRWGRLRVAGLEPAGLKLGGLDLPLALVPNRLLTGRALELPLWGGRLRLEDLEVREPLSGRPRAGFGLQIAGLDLGRVPLKTMRLKGKLAGRLRPVELTPRRLVAGGGLQGELFGGKLEITGIEVLRPFSPGREIVLRRVRARGMDLKGLTTALGAGVITGRVNVDLKGLRMAYGQPVAFDLTVRSVPVEGVPQRVSLKAVNSISVLGTGTGLSGFGISLARAFFEEFPYQEIGFACSLKNDVFRIRGLIRDGRVEYLVKKPPLMGINVVNRNQDNRISFSDMLKRLRRVRGGPSSSAAGDKKD